MHLSFNIAITDVINKNCPVIIDDTVWVTRRRPLSLLLQHTHTQTCTQTVTSFLRTKTCFLPYYHVTLKLCHPADILCLYKSQSFASSKSNHFCRNKFLVTLTDYTGDECLCAGTVTARLYSDSDTETRYSRSAALQHPALRRLKVPY